MRREAYQNHLQSLSDTALRDEAVARIREYRALPQGSSGRAEGAGVASLVWAEACRRGRQDAYNEALELVRAEERAAAEANRKAIEELPRKE